jgi:hypothetical protein
MENKTKRSPLVIIPLLVAATFAACSGAALLLTTQVVSANVNVPTDALETNVSIAPSNNKNNAITLAEKPFLVEHGKTVAANPINQTHIQILLAGNGTIMLPNSTETIKTKDTGNAIVRLTPTGDIAQGQIHMITEDGGEKRTVFFTEVAQNGRGVGVAYFTTDSTGKIGYLDNIVAVIQDELQPDGNTLITAWEWMGE